MHTTVVIKSVSTEASLMHLFFIQFNVPFKIISAHMRRANQ